MKTDAPDAGISYRKDSLVVFFIAFSLGVFFSFPVLFNPYRFHDNWRQVPHWTAPSTQHFQPDDILLRYAKFNTSQFANFMYTNLARTGLDLIWAKLNGILFFALAILAAFRVGCVMRDRICGWLAACIFALFPCIFPECMGGFMSGLSIPLLGAAVLLVATQKWWWSIPFIILASLAYPMVAIFSGLYFIFDTLANDRHNMTDRELWKRKLIPLFIAAVCCVIILFSGKYSSSYNEFGSLATRSDILDRVEFTRKGRYPLMPVPSLWSQLKSHWGNSFHLALFLSAFFVLGRRVFALPRGLYSMLLTGFSLYIVSDIVLMRLYIPDRYVRYSLPLFAALCGGYWLSQMIALEGKRILSFSSKYFSIRISSVLLVGLILCGTGFYEFHKELEPGLKTYSYNRHGLHPFLRSLPGRPLIAAHPKLASEIPVLTGKSVLVSSELSHPWWSLYWKEISRRTKDFFNAYYTSDPRTLRIIIKRYNIDYWVVSPAHFKRKYLSRKRRLVMEPFNKWVRRQHYDPENALLNKIPSRFAIYKSKRYSVIPSTNILQWLDELEK